MKVKDLIALLQEYYNEDAEVVLQGDDEGNYYKLVRGVEEDSYHGSDISDSPAFLSHYSSVDEMVDDFCFNGEEIEDFIGSLKDVVVIY